MNKAKQSLHEMCPYSEFFWSECGKMRMRKTPNMDTFYAVNAFRIIYFDEFLFIPRIFPIAETTHLIIILLLFVIYNSWYISIISVLHQYLHQLWWLMWLRYLLLSLPKNQEASLSWGNSAFVLKYRFYYWRIRRFHQKVICASW